MPTVKFVSIVWGSLWSSGERARSATKGSAVRVPPILTSTFFRESKSLANEIAEV